MESDEEDDAEGEEEWEEGDEESGIGAWRLAGIGTAAIAGGEHGGGRCASAYAVGL